MSMTNDTEHALIASKVHVDMATHALGPMVGSLRHVLEFTEPEVLGQAQRVIQELARLNVVVATAMSKRKIL